MRGKESSRSMGTDQSRITPACAGKSRRGLLRRTAVRGSPPRVRGKVEPFKGSMYQSRITPACAGKRSKSMPPCCRSWDHPRVCGEKPPAGDGLNLILGSPPRVRGKDFPTVPGQFFPGITPACAGKSLTIPKLSTPSRDHPRVCGEKACRRGHCAP